MKKENIAFAITTSEVGGAQAWVKDQIDIALESDKFNQVHLITASHGWLTNNLPGCIKLHLIPEIESIMSFVTISKMQKVYREYDIKITISNSANAGLYARLAGFIQSSTKQIYVSHGWSAIYNGGKFKKMYVLIEKILGNFFSDKILCVSNSDAHKAKTKIGIKPNKLVTIRNAVNCDPITLVRAKSQESNILKLVFVGRIAKPKRHDLVIEAVSMLAEICTLDIVGGGNKLSLPAHCENVQVIGEVESFSNYQRYDAMILISDSEGLPMVTLEAGSNALPMILSNVGGCPEVINHNGIVVSNNTQSIRTAIIEMHKNYKNYSNAAFSVMNEFDLENQKSTYIDMYLSNI